MATLNLLSPDKVKHLAALKVVEEPFQMNVWKKKSSYSEQERPSVYIIVANRARYRATSCKGQETENISLRTGHICDSFSMCRTTPRFFSTARN